MRVLFCYLLLLTSPVLVRAQIEDAPQIFRELEALDGVWFMPTDRGDRLEIWNIRDDSTMDGRHLRIRLEDGDTVTLETMRLEWRGEHIRYITIPRGQNRNEPVVYELTAADYDGYLFENPAHDDPQKIRYRLLGNREIQVNTEGKRGNRTVTQEYVFEREFTPGAVAFRLRAGVNAFTMRQTGTLLAKPAFEWRPGWELGTTFAFKGRGGFITLNVDVSLLGKNAHVFSEFATVEQSDTGEVFVFYRRDVTYRQIWLGLGVFPEITLKRDGRLSAFAGPYVARQLFNRAQGEELPGGDNKLFDANNDFRNTDIGVLAGFQYRLNIGKRDMDGLLGLRANIGLANIDNLYDRGCNNPAFCNGRVGLLGVSLYYSVNLLKL